MLFSLLVGVLWAVPVVTRVFLKHENVIKFEQKHKSFEQIKMEKFCEMCDLSILKLIIYRYSNNIKDFREYLH